jgi:hypothetical protein
MISTAAHGRIIAIPAPRGQVSATSLFRPQKQKTGGEQ